MRQEIALNGICGQKRYVPEGYSFRRQKSIKPADIRLTDYYGDFPFLSALNSEDELNSFLGQCHHATLFRREIPIGTIGMAIFIPGVADGFFLPHEGLAAHKKALLRWSRDFIVAACFENNIRRLQTAIDFNRQNALRFAMALGLKPEATLKSYGLEGQDFLLMARIFRS